MNARSADLASEPGVSLALARSRAAALSQIRYQLDLTVTADLAVPVTGRVTARFMLAAAQDVVFDFASAMTSLRRTLVGGELVEPSRTSEHILIPRQATRAGDNEVTFDFVADPAALNRQPDFLYSLFVPARARLAFPCFDQPDLKARWLLVLHLPAGWDAVSNAPVDTDLSDSRGRRICFRETELLPTYLFAFVAGQLAVERGTRNGRVIHVWHREHDVGLIERNLDAVIDLHATALSWLESYTGIPYPFSQFNMVLVPSFQFSGMEHPGAILYNAGRLLLESSATEHDHLTRAALIAHETAHMWFGDLVTMRWFDEVWLKEVFANFAAEKVLADALPTHNHDLRFFLANYPAAYAVDRSEGANAIHQTLENLSAAGQLYGPIIYLKAPIAFRQLELLLGTYRFQDGVRRYLNAHRFGNATWADLLKHFASDGVPGIHEWSTAWTEEAGRPTVTVDSQLDSNGRLAGLVCRTIDPTGRGREWPQQVSVALGYGDRVDHVTLRVGSHETAVPVNGERPLYVLGGGGGLGYAHFPLDGASREWLLNHVEDVPDALTRGVAHMSLWDELLEGSIPARAWLETTVRALALESDPQNLERLLAVVVRAFWLFLSATERDVCAPTIETCLASRLTSATTTATRSSLFATLRQVAITRESCDWLERIWRRDEHVPGLMLREGDETALALDLAVRSAEGWREILGSQRTRIQDPERLARFTFVSSALSREPHEREAAFARLRHAHQRAREPWVLTVLHYLNHPLRQAHARRFIRPGLDLLPEILKTGDIFFPTRWAEALLSGHSSPAAAAIVREFLHERTEWSPRLQNTVLTAADLLFRAARPAS